MNVTPMGVRVDMMLNASSTGMLVNAMAGMDMVYMSRWKRPRGREIILRIQYQIRTQHIHTRQNQGGNCLRL